MYGEEEKKIFDLNEIMKDNVPTLQRHNAGETDSTTSQDDSYINSYVVTDNIILLSSKL